MDVWRVVRRSQRKATNENEFAALRKLETLRDLLAPKPVTDHATLSENKIENPGPLPVYPY